MLATASSFTNGVGPDSAQCSRVSSVSMATAQTDFGTNLLLQLDKILDDAELQLTRVFKDHKSQFQEVIGKLQQQCMTLSIENERLIRLLETKPFSRLPMDFMGKETTVADHPHSTNKLSTNKSPTLLHLIQKFDQGMNRETTVGDTNNPMKRDMNSMVFVPTPPVTSCVESTTPLLGCSESDGGISSDNANTGCGQAPPFGHGQRNNTHGGGVADSTTDNAAVYIHNTNYNWLSRQQSDIVSPLPTNDSDYGAACAHGDIKGATWTKVPPVLEEDSNENWEESSGWTTSSGDTDNGQLRCHSVRKNNPTGRHLDLSVIKELVDIAQQVVDKSFNDYGLSRSKTNSEPGQPQSQGCSQRAMRDVDNSKNESYIIFV